MPRLHEIGELQRFVAARGAEILEPTNPYEVLRFRSHGGLTSVVYKNGKGEVTHLMNEAEPALLAMRGGGRWEAGNATRKRKSTRTERDISALFERDGPQCFFCPAFLAPETATIEHLVARANGGPNHLSNYVLACKPCNAEQGVRSVAEKVRANWRRKDTP